METQTDDTIQKRHTIARYGDETNARHIAQIKGISFEELCSQTYLKSINNRKWHNNSEFCKDKGLPIKTWHVTNVAEYEGETYAYYEYHNGKGATYFQRQIVRHV